MSLHFRYQIPIWRNVMGVVFCITASVGMGYVSYFNQKALRLFRVVMFSPETASLIYWTFTAVLLFSTILFAKILLRSIKGAVVVILDETHVTVPKSSLKDGLLSIPYSSIKQILVENVSHQQFLTINSSVGQGCVLSNGFRSDEEFSCFKQALTTRLNGSLEESAN